ncbi:MAG TPA: response regulator [Candidatus Acidoferrales bacterium]|nr:response regulator [Candidatus Acidoferrales bacterium]
MKTSLPILVASADLESRRALKEILEREGYDAICTSRLSECVDVLASHDVQLVFSEKNLADGSYRDLMQRLKALRPNTRVVVTSRHADWDEYKEVLQEGAFDLIASPCQPTDVLWMIIQAKRDEYQRSTLAKTTTLAAAAAVGA